MDIPHINYKLAVIKGTTVGLVYFGLFFFLIFHS